MQPVQIADVKIAKVADGDRPIRVCIVVVARLLLRGCDELCFRATAADAWPKPRNDTKRALLAVLQQRGRKRQGSPELRSRIGMRKRPRHHADDGVASSVQLDRASHHFGRCVKPAAPQRVAQHDDVVAPSLAVLRQKRAPERRRGAEH